MYTAAHLLRLCLSGQVVQLVMSGHVQMLKEDDCVSMVYLVLTENRIPLWACIHSIVRLVLNAFINVMR